MSSSTAAGVGVQVAQLAAMATAYPDEVGYRVVDGGQLTFSQWDRQSSRLARGLVASGVGHGDRVALRLSGMNAVRWVVAYAAIHKAAGVAVPIDPRLAPPEVVHMLAHAGVVALITDGERVESALASVADEPDRLAALSVVVDASITDVDGAEPPSSGEARGGGGAGPRCLSWDEALDDDGSAFQLPVVMTTSPRSSSPRVPRDIPKEWPCATPTPPRSPTPRRRGAEASGSMPARWPRLPASPSCTPQ